MLEEMIRQLQEDNEQMRAKSEIEMQVRVQRQVESQLQEDMRKQELEVNAREEARERERQRKMDDINSMLKRFMDPHPPQYLDNTRTWLTYFNLFRGRLIMVLGTVPMSPFVEQTLSLLRMKQERDCEHAKVIKQMIEDTEDQMREKFAFAEMLKRM
uniref:Transposase, Ptta/En/Spm n=1 Tax=Tanacetum cinerariifolium TaxID=118510 RepID=A0A6L2JUA7_TANCI|nr:transposase, Ptta/En/Spm [Tanacetum cinerariifolium]